MARIKFECCHCDTCLSSYWSGHHLPYVQIPVQNGMSLKEIKEAIFDELKQGYVMGSNDYARLLSADLVKPEEDYLADKVTRAAYAAVNRIKPAKKGQRKFFTDLDKTDENDYDESVYAFFVFVEID